jgi:hypothetical protein
MTNQVEIQKLAAQMASEKDPEKQKAVRLQLVAKINEEKAAKKAAEDKAAAGPTYPEGLTATYEGKSATITEAYKNSNGEWIYVVDVKAGMPFEIGDGVYNLSETDLRKEMVERFNATLAPGQAFAAGMEVRLGGRGGPITNVQRNAAGAFEYVVAGWGAPVTQREFLGILTRV